MLIMMSRIYCWVNCKTLVRKILRRFTKEHQSLVKESMTMLKFRRRLNTHYQLIAR